MASSSSKWRQREGRGMQQGSREENLPSLTSRLAIFGDSNVALIISFVMLVLAIIVATFLDQEPIPDPIQLTSNPVARLYKHENKLSREIMTAYERDGVIAIRGILDKDLLDRIDVESQDVVKNKKTKTKKGTQFFQVEVGLALHNQAFRDVALSSKIAFVSAQLLQLSENTTMRMLRDIFLVKDDDQYICGWHTDDTGFWPATADAPGINVWIALDDMPIAGGGGFALAVGSQSASWREEAHRVTGSTMTLPKDGFRDVADMFANRTGSGTCNIKTSAPHLHLRMEEAKRVYDIRRGDVIFHERWLFHRTVPFDRGFARQLNDPLYRRYSVRFGPGYSRVPPGYGLELSVLWNADNAGRPADKVCEIDGPWYPQAWPTVNQAEMEQLPLLVSKKLPIAEAARKLRQKEMKPFLEELRKKQYN